MTGYMLRWKFTDVDHDGINDGDELHYWNVTRGLPLNESIAYCKNPDVDNDSIPDGKEIKGYSVKIITDWDSKGEPISEKRFISPNELDPLIPYTNSSGVYLDTDKDGIPDVVEKWFGNASIVTNSSYRQEFIQKFGWSLYHKYSWVISYFWTVYNRDYKAHHNKTSAMQNATQWLQDQFNPMVRDKTPPVITLFKLHWDVKFSVSTEPVKVYAVVHLVVRDVGGIYSLKIVDESSGVVYTVDVSAHHTMYDVQHRFKASALDAAFGAVKIRIITADYAGNTLDIAKKLKGALQQMLDALAKMWSEIWSVLCKVAQAMANAVNFIVEWIKSSLEKGFSILSEKMEEFEMMVYKACVDFIVWIYSNNTQNAIHELLYILSISTLISMTIFGLYWALAIAVNANPLIGTIIGVIVMAVFMAVFYTFYPKEYREAGEALISVGDLLLMPADKVYEFDKQYCGSMGWLLTAITATMGTVWSGAITNSAVSAFITWSLGIVTLSAALVLMDANYHDTTVKKIIAVGLLGIASYALVSTVTAGWKSIVNAETLGGKIVSLMFFGLFTFISLYSVLTIIGYLHKG